jgi:NAD(P)-dependent dehydrogenase (short-subunit alcohol dehydrogenase family)
MISIMKTKLVNTLLTRLSPLFIARFDEHSSWCPCQYRVGRGLKAIEGRPAYCTAKAGVIMLTQVLGIERVKRGVRVVGIAPGVVMTELVAKVIADGWASSAVYERRTPMRRLGTIEDIAEAALFLACDDASYVTAETLRVDVDGSPINSFRLKHVRRPKP